MRVAVNPQRVEAPASQARAQPEGPRPPEREPASRSHARQKLMTVAVEQRHVPFHVHAKARVAIGVDREIAQKENRQLDSRTRREIAEQRRLVLDRMTDQARDAVASPSIVMPTCGFEFGLTLEHAPGRRDHFIDADRLDAFVVVRADVEKAGVALDVLHQHFVLRAVRPPHPGEFAPREERDAWRADRGRKMLHAGVVANQHRAAREHFARIANGGLARRGSRRCGRSLWRFARTSARRNRHRARRSR